MVLTMSFYIFGQLLVVPFSLSTCVLTHTRHCDYFSLLLLVVSATIYMLIRTCNWSHRLAVNNICVDRSILYSISAAYIDFSHRNLYIVLVSALKNRLFSTLRAYCIYSSSLKLYALHWWCLSGGRKIKRLFSR